MYRCFLTVLIVALITLNPAAIPVFADQLLEDFEAPVELNRFSSYPGEDQQSTSWRIDTAHGAESTSQSLYLYGNTWKRYFVSDWNYTISPDSVWKIYLLTPSRASIQGFGISDGTHDIRYIIQANDITPVADAWIPVYAGWKNTNSTFTAIKLPVGQDWFDRYPSASPVTLAYFLFFNDQDSSSGQVYFDQIRDITDSEPSTPSVSISAPASAQPQSPVVFSAQATDPDSSTFTWEWDFGDGQSSALQNPMHAFSIPGRYNVLCQVKDPTSLVAFASHHIVVGDDRNPVISMSFGGDCMLARRYEDADENGTPGDGDGSLIMPGDGGSGAKSIASQLRRLYADETIVNLESPLTDEGSPHPTKSITFRSRPDAVSAISELGSRLVCLANNHLIDYSDRGLQETLQVLANPTGYSSYALPGRIQGPGAGVNFHEASLPRTIAEEGLRVAFVGMCSIVGLPANEQPFFMAGYEKPGVLEMNSFNIQRTVSECERIADLTIVLLHGGIEYAQSPSSTVSACAREAIDAGADLVICHHPHVTQGIELYNGKIIAYSLGNMIFDQKYQNTMQTLMLDARMDRDGVHLLSVLPAYLEKYQPRFIRGDAGYRILEQLMGLSDDLENTILPFEDLNRGIVLPDISYLDETVSSQSNAVPTSYRSIAGAYLSPMIRLENGSILKRINSISGTSGSRSLMLGHDLFMFGNCEEEDMDNETLEGIGWELPGNVSASISATTPHQGSYCLRLRRQSSHTSDISVESSDRIPIATDRVYSLSGYYRLVNAIDARVYIKGYYYPYTYTSYLDTEQLLLGPVDGNRDWTYFEVYFTAPNSLTYASIMMQLSPPESGDYGYAYFDEVRLVEFSEVSNPALPYVFSYPGNTRYIALKTGSTQSSAQLNYSIAEYSADDQDSDGLFDFLEDVNGNIVVDPGETDPLLEDTDGDGLDDFEELRFGTDGFITNPTRVDTDSDGYDDLLETQGGYNPNDPRIHPTGPTATATQTPAFTSTPELPTGTPTPSSTQTAVPTSTMTPTIASTDTPGPGTSTPAPSSTPTPTPTATHPDDPTFTPTPPGTTATPTIPPGLSINLILSDQYMHSGDSCWVNLEMTNGADTIQVDLYVLLDVFGAYFCYPTWQSIGEGLTFQTLTLHSGEQKHIEVIGSFIMPATSEAGPLFFYSVCMRSGYFDMSNIVSNVASIDFMIGP